MHRTVRLVPDDKAGAPKAGGAAPKVSGGTAPKVKPTSAPKGPKKK
jgi:hypothetical protein